MRLDAVLIVSISEQHPHVISLKFSELSDLPQAQTYPCSLGIQAGCHERKSINRFSSISMRNNDTLVVF